MKYSDFIGKQTVILEEREDTEWSNFWIDKANTTSNSRTLLIGDSTSRMIRSTLAKKLGTPVDLLASSSGLHDALFVNQMDCFFNSHEYKYQRIFVQIGHHAEIGVGGGKSESDWRRFEEDFSALIDFLQRKSDFVYVESIYYSVMANSKWKLNKMLHIKEQYDATVNERKKKKNDIMKMVSERKGLKYIDINQYMLDCKKNFYHKDHIHFEDRAKDYIVEKLTEYMKMENN